jgi:hypothetical protein
MLTDTLIRFSDVPNLKWLPRRRGSGKLSLATLWRWSARGVKGIRLRCVAVGGSKCTTEPWLREFFQAVADADRTAPTMRTPARRQREIEAAEKRLAAAGV